MKPPKELRLSDDWRWYVVKALYGMRVSSKAFQEVVRDVYDAYEWTLLQTTILCLRSPDARCEACGESGKSP